MTSGVLDINCSDISSCNIRNHLSSRMYLNQDEDNTNQEAVKNERLDTLLKQIHVFGGDVMGSQQSRTLLRVKIHSLIYNIDLPSIFITIKPGDVHHPIAIYFTGVNQNLDKILADEYPSRYDRAQLVAIHPVAIAKFFDKLIQTIINTLLIDYYGIVENQGRESFHLHMLLWMNHNMTPPQLRSRIKDENCRNNIISYLEDIIKEDLDCINPVFEHLISVSKSGLDETIYIDNRIMADAFDEEIKNKYLSTSDLEQQVEIIIENSPYVLVRQVFDKNATRLKKAI
ncbi:unnamed protein product [Rotaria sp. Silwood2]|nr:unnamed protein product [Rotaria sp. Silwood2]